MKRRVFAVVLALALSLCLAAASAPAYAGEKLVLDGADLLSDTQEARLSQKLNSISKAHNAQIIVATVASVEGGDVDEYVEIFYDSMGYGYGERRDGVLLLVCMDPREYRILSNGFAASAIKNGEIAAIGEKIVSHLSDGDYAAAFDKFAEECDYYLNGFRSGFSFDFKTNLIVALAVGLVAGLAVALALKAQLKSGRRQNQANAYVKPGSMRVTVRSDLFLYRHVSRIRKASDNAPGRGGGGHSRNVGGGSF